MDSLFYNVTIHDMELFYLFFLTPQDISKLVRRHSGKILIHVEWVPVRPSTSSFLCWQLKFLLSHVDSISFY